MTRPLAGRGPEPAFQAALVDHANRGVRLQVRLRFVLVAFVVATIVIVVPPQGVGASTIIAAAYLLAAVVFAVWSRRGGSVVAEWGWVGLFVDVVALAALALVTGVGAHDSWTDDVLLEGLFLIPVLAATQLRPAICATVVGPTVAIYLAAGWWTADANGEPYNSVVLQSAALLAVGVGCVALSRIQRSRVTTIGALLADRSRLLDDLLELEDRERRDLSEQLHDGALQYVLAARQDLDDVRDGIDGSTDRVQHALVESARLLRSTVGELNPAVLQHAGLAKALTTLAEAQSRPERPVRAETRDWPAALQTPLDPLLYSAARELLSNAAKHADASTVVVRLARDGTRARLEVIDDGRGHDDHAVDAALAAGHIGLHSHRLRTEAAGGSLTLTAAEPHGTVATVEVPLPS